MAQNFFLFSTDLGPYRHTLAQKKNVHNRFRPIHWLTQNKTSFPTDLGPWIDWPKKKPHSPGWPNDKLVHRIQFMGAIFLGQVSTWSLARKLLKRKVSPPGTRNKLKPKSWPETWCNFCQNREDPAASRHHAGPQLRPPLPETPWTLWYWGVQGGPLN